MYLSSQDRNALLSSLPKATLGPLQLAKNSAICLITRSKRCEHTTLVLQALHWLYVQYNTIQSAHRGVQGANDPGMFHMYWPARALHSMDAKMSLTASLPRGSRRKGVLFCWTMLSNSVPDTTRASPSVEAFKSNNLKTIPQ